MFAKSSNNRIVVYTCITGNYDRLYPIINPSPHVDYVCFTDNPDLTQEGWIVCPLPDFVNEAWITQVKKQRLVKILPYRAFGEGQYDVSIWIDGNMRVFGDIERYFLPKYDLKKFSFWTNKHPTRDDIYEEELAVIRMKKDDYKVTHDQVEVYRLQGYPAHSGMVESNVILRDMNDRWCKRLMFMWAEEIMKGSHRDQLSFNYCAWKQDFKYGLLKENYLDPAPINCFNRKRHSKWVPDQKFRDAPVTKSVEVQKPVTENKIEPVVKAKMPQAKEKQIQKSKLDLDLIVSLTTYKPRLLDNTLFEVLPALLSQKTNLKYKICITLFKDDLKYVNAKLNQFFKHHKIEIIVADKNLRPHLKYFYAMQKYRDLPVITVDDDCIYYDNLIQSLWDSYKKNPSCISARRVHKIKYFKNGCAMPYKNWIQNDKTIKTPSYDLLATGVGGVLYPPDILKISNDDLSDIEKSITADDIFLKKKENDLKIKVLRVNYKFESYKPQRTYAANYALCIAENRMKNDMTIKAMGIRKVK